MATVPSEPRGRSRRERPAKPPLSEAAVIDAGLRVLRAEGLEAVTMRRVGKELDTGAASLYVYVKNRDELRELMFDRIAASVEMPEVDVATWRPALRQLCVDMRDAMEAHPGIASHAIAKIPVGEGALRLADRKMALLLAGGVAPQDAAWASDNLWLIVTATAVETDLEESRGRAPTGGPGFTFDDLRRKFAALPPEQYPALSQHHEAMTSGTQDARFLFAIDTYLDGLMALSRRRPKA